MEKAIPVETWRERMGREKSGKIAPNDLLPFPAVNATKPMAKPGK